MASFQRALKETGSMADKEVRRYWGSMCVRVGCLIGRCNGAEGVRYSFADVVWDGGEESPDFQTMRAKREAHRMSGDRDWL